MKDIYELKRGVNEKPETQNYKPLEFLIFESMHPVTLSRILVENLSIPSEFLKRDVLVDFYLPLQIPGSFEMNLLLINDGQNMKELGLGTILEQLYTEQAIEPVLCVAIHAGEDRKMEHGIASQTDY